MFFITFAPRVKQDLETLLRSSRILRSMHIARDKMFVFLKDFLQILSQPLHLNNRTAPTQLYLYKNATRPFKRVLCKGNDFQFKIAEKFFYKSNPVSIHFCPAGHFIQIFRKASTLRNGFSNVRGKSRRDGPVQIRCASTRSPRITLEANVFPETPGEAACADIRC